MFSAQEMSPTSPAALTSLVTTATDGKTWVLPVMVPELTIISHAWSQGQTPVVFRSLDPRLLPGPPSVGPTSALRMLE